MYRCRFCGTEYQNLEGLDHSDEGFFCDDCDSFTYFQHIKNKHQFKLFLEENGEANQKSAQIKFNKRLSPLRYPGGKTKMLPQMIQSINNENTKTFVEPFAGGAGVGLALLDANLIENYVLNDIDFGIYALFEIIKNNPDELIYIIKNIVPTRENFFEARTKIQNKYITCSLIDAAWSLLITNRLAYSGITKANPLGGKNGTNEQLLSRWNPCDLIKRITKIHSFGNKITVTNQDALQVIEEYYWTPNTTIFVDPPYFKKGKQLYTHYYETGQHIELSNLLQSLSTGCPGADIILTYDNEPFIKELYFWSPPQNITLKYSI